MSPLTTALLALCILSAHCHKIPQNSQINEEETLNTAETAHAGYSQAGSFASANSVAGSANYGQNLAGYNPQNSGAYSQSSAGSFGNTGFNQNQNLNQNTGYNQQQDTGFSNQNIAHANINKDTKVSVGDIPENPPKTPYWWFDNDSPFKHKFRKVSSIQFGTQVNQQSGSGYQSGSTHQSPPLNHGTAHVGQLDLSQNPFLNGEHKQGSYNHGSSSQSGSASGSSSQSGSSAFGTSGNQGSYHGSTNQGTQLNLQDNPFLNKNPSGQNYGQQNQGQYNQNSGSSSSSGSFGQSNGQFGQSGSQFGGQSTTGQSTGQFGSQNTQFGHQSSTGQSTGQSNGQFGSTNTQFGQQSSTQGQFGSTQGQSNGQFGSTSTQFGQNANTGSIGSNQFLPNTVACSGDRKICVSKHLCLNGVVNSNGEGLFQVRSQTQFCDTTSQVCCSLPYEQSNSGINHQGSNNQGANSGANSGAISGSQCDSNVATCVPKNLCLNGFLNVNGENIFQVRSQIQHCAPTDVCCRYPQTVLQQAPNHSSTSQSHISSQTNVPVPSEVLKPGSVIQNGQYIEYGSQQYQKLPQQLLQSLTTTGYNTGYYAGQNPNAQDLSNPNKATVLGQTSGSYSQSSAASFSQSAASSFSSSGSYTGTNSGIPSGTNSGINGAPRYEDQLSAGTNGVQAQVLSPSGGNPYNYPKPSQEYLPQATNQVTTKKPFQGDAYIPPKDDKHFAGSHISGANILPPKRPVDDEKQTGGTNDSPTILRPNQGGQKISPVQRPSPQHGCAAALKCVDISFCTFEGVISKSQVTLTPRQHEYRVPLTDCLIPSSTSQSAQSADNIGKCCRDPDYVDPWPASQLGQYDPDKLPGDNGQYKGERFQSKHRPNQV